MHKIRQLLKTEKVRKKDRDREDLKSKGVEFWEKCKCRFAERVGGGEYGDIVAIRAIAFGKNTKLATKIVPSWSISKGEQELWQTLDHEKVLPLIDSISMSNMDIYITPYLKASLHTILLAQSLKRNKRSFELTKIWLADILHGLEYLHQKELCHLDIKTDNIFITPKKKAVLSGFTFLNFSHEPSKQ